MSDHWFKVWHKEYWRRVPVDKKRSYYFTIRGRSKAEDRQFSSYVVATVFEGFSAKELEEKATLSVLFDFKWWHFSPGEWHFGGEWG